MKLFGLRSPHDSEERSDSIWRWVHDKFRRLTLRSAHKKFALEGRYCTRSSAGLFIEGSAQWLQVLHDQMSNFRGRGFVLANTTDSQSRLLTYDLSVLGFDVDMCNDHDAVMGVFQDAQAVEGVDRLWTILVVDLDFLTASISLVEIADDLLALRRSMANLNIIILSNEVDPSDAIGATRSPMADVSLRSPVSLMRLLEAVWDARLNNIIWRSQIKARAVPQEMQDVDQDFEAPASVGARSNLG